MIFKVLILIVSGAIGTVARYSLSGFVHQIGKANFPYGTLVVNLSGCLIIGFLAAITEKKFLLGPEMRLFLMVGFCGAFTTFSTFILETDHLFRDGEMLRAIMNIFLSVVLGFLLFRVGAFLGESI